MGSTYFSKRLPKNKRYSTPRYRSKRAKTFKTEEAAKKYAEANKIKDYSLENLKSPESKQKKFRIVIKS